MKFFSPLRLASVILIALALVAPVTRADDAPKAPSTGKCMMWKVSSDTATVYLVGSMHLATADLYPLPREMEEAFAKSDLLVVEVNINKVDQQQILKLVQEKGMYGGDDTLPKHLSADHAKALEAACKDVGLPIEGVSRLKPWVVGMTLEVLGIQKLGLDPKLGIDKHFLDAAEKSDKKIEELESADFQVNLLAGFDDKLQEQALAATLEEVKSLKEDIGKLVEAWKSGDADAMATMLKKPANEHPELEEVQKKIIDDRNGPMADKIEAYLKGNKTAFVVAGVAHMIGEKGIIKLLQDRKLAVTQSPATPADKPKTEPAK